jgi:hypothetical protein
LAVDVPGGRVLADEKGAMAGRGSVGAEKRGQGVEGEEHGEAEEGLAGVGFG